MLRFGKHFVIFNSATFSKRDIFEVNDSKLIPAKLSVLALPDTRPGLEGRNNTTYQIYIYMYCRYLHLKRLTNEKHHKQY